MVDPVVGLVPCLFFLVFCAAKAQHLTVCHGGKPFHQGDDGMLSKDLTVRQPPRKEIFFWGDIEKS